MSLECIWCPDWTPQMTIVNGFVQIASIRAGQDLYAQAGGKPFSYCPFCGHELHEVAQPPPQSGEQK